MLHCLNLRSIDHHLLHLQHHHLVLHEDHLHQRLQRHPRRLRGQHRLPQHHLLPEAAHQHLHLAVHRLPQLFLTLRPRPRAGREDRHMSNQK